MESDDIWSEVSADISDAMPQFNDYLIGDYGYRKDCIDGIKGYLDKALEQTAVFFNSKHDQLQFIGHEVVRETAFTALCQSILQFYICKRAAHHDFMIAAARAIRVEIDGLHASLH